MALYKGYSSHEYAANKTFGIADVQLVKLDLLNHIYTRRGDRVMMPTFGTRIPDMAFEPLDIITISIVEEDLRSVFIFDPRVQLISLDMVPDYDNSSLTASALLKYIELDIIDNMDLHVVFEGG